LNEVCTSLLVFEGDGKISEYVGGYDDWQRERAARAASAAAAEEAAKRAAKTAAAEPAAGAPKPRKLTNKARAELEALPKRIETLEAEQTQLTAALADPVFFKKPGGDVARATARLQEIEAELAAAYARWAELE
jgi:ATP-binding cassette subfamily F protein uup